MQETRNETDPGIALPAMRTPTDVEFERFARTRDPVALAAVFDHTAPSLLLVAMHLCGDAADAEDLVQTVFLQAIRDAARYDPAQPVLPWLLGILQHRAVDLRRAAHRRRERTPFAEAAAPERDEPDQAVASQETLQQIAASLDALPAPYREVLTLRLVHGLRAVDIAHAQSASPETVRTRLRRGLEMLRKLLPKGIATPALLALLGGESLRAGVGLAAVKQVVLRGLQVASATAAVGGAVLMKWLLAGAAVAAASLLWVLVMAPDATVAPPAMLPAVAPVVAGAASDGMKPGASVAEPQRVEVERKELPTPPDPASLTTIRGRVTAAESGAPIAGATVRLQGTVDGARSPVVTHWPDPAATSTDADGAFAVRLAPPPECRFTLLCSAPGRVEQALYWNSLRQGVAVDCGDVTLQQGTAIRITLRDEHQQPWPGIPVHGKLAQAVSPDPARQLFLATTDAAGSALVAALPPGRWHYDLGDMLGGIDGATGEFDLPLQDTPFQLDITLPQPAPGLAVAGIVLDEQGRPLPDLDLEIPVGDGCWPVTTRADGSFLHRLRKPPDGDPSFRLRLPQASIDFALVDDGGEFHWGRMDLKPVVRHRAAASLTLTVVDAATGTPVPHFAASCRFDRWRVRGIPPAAATQILADDNHAEGRLRFDDLPPGPYRVTVVPGEPFPAAEELPIELAEGQQATLRVMLQHRAPLQVEVVDRAGTPMPGVTVQLGRVLPEDQLDQADLKTTRVPVSRISNVAGERIDILMLDVVTTDDAGRAVLHAVPDTPALVVVAEGARYLPSLTKRVSLPAAGGSLRIQVDAAATLAGTVRPLALLQKFGPSTEELAKAAEDAKVSLPNEKRFAGRYGELQLRPAGSNRPQARTKLAADGSFRLTSLPPGRCEVWLQFRVDSSMASIGPLASVELRGGDEASLDLDASAFLPGRVHARFFVDGAPWTGEAGLARRSADSLDVNLHIQCDDRGNALSPLLLPGTYVPFVGKKSGWRTLFAFADEEITVAPGAEVEATVALHPRRLAIKLLDADGKPAANRTLVTEPLDHPEWKSLYRFGEQTDAHGVAVIEHAPLGRLRVRTFAADQDPARFDLPSLVLGEVDAGNSAATVRLPR